MSSHDEKKKQPLYQKVADDIESLILQGMYETGSRIPSIRKMSENLKVSINTIKEAYAILESRQLVEGRPHRGYFVKDIDVRKLQIPDPAHSFRPNTLEITGNFMFQRILEEVMDSRYVPLGMATASPSLLPLQDFSSLISSMTENQKKQSLMYAPPEGMPELRNVIAKKLLDSGLTLTANDILITSGCEEALFLALSAITSPGDTIAVQSPIYSNLVLTFKNLGLKILEIPSDPDDGISLDILEYGIEHNEVKACLVISNFNNPTGSVIPDKNKRRLTDILKTAGIPLLEDDVYGDLYFEGTRPSTCRTYDKSGNTVLCSSFSKTVSPGLRVGYIVPGKFKDAIIQHKIGSNICTSTISQLLLSNYLQSGGYYKQLRKLRSEVGERMKMLREDVRKFFPQGTKMTDPKGGYTLWVELPGNVSGLDLYEKAINENIAIVPGGLFSQNNLFRRFIRLDAGCYSRSISYAVARLGELTMELMFK
ncbi:PLP-dependent aminotransferase family protein [Spirochaeta isovalerica]|uniref:DNA-binding transcriptional MocR family regulator n=1 Tax=Spirochaeta isovalerica TaxID=150 RepID=A0A841RFT2_9SPIO|nr:PLP-dependent aminotransferase family protein [Spirochaeta isovalerica]MBB6482446.1 DNA-binding transcriptional MocR family regulator [Spirochaeta isovalerica]